MGLARPSSFFPLRVPVFLQDTQRLKYLVPNATELFSRHIGDRWSPGSNKSLVFFHPQAYSLSCSRYWLICAPPSLLPASFSFPLFPGGAFSLLLSSLSFSFLYLYLFCLSLFSLFVFFFPSSLSIRSYFLFSLALHSFLLPHQLSLLSLPFFLS